MRQPGGTGDFAAEQLKQWMDEDEADMRRFKAGA